MGLFSKSKQQSQSADGTYEPASEQEAWIGIMLACATVDGHISDAETEYIAKALTFKKHFAEYDTVELYRKTIGGYQELGSNGLLDVCAPKISDEWKNSVFANAVDLVVHDGNVEPNEEKIIEHLKKKLAMSDDFAQNTVNVLIEKHKGNYELIDSEDDEFEDDDY